MRTDTLALQVSGVDVPQATDANYVIGLLVVGTILVATLAYREYSKDSGLPERNRAHRRAVLGAKADQTPATRTFDGAAIRRGAVALQAHLGELFDRPDGVIGAERATLRQAVAEVRAAVAAAWVERTDGIPGIVLLALRRAVWVAVTGAVALETAIIVRYLSTEPDYPTLPELYADTLYYLGRGVTEGRGLAGEFPYAGLLWDLTLAYGILTVQWLYEHWYAVAAVLLLGAVVIYALARRAPYDPGGERTPRRYRLAYWLGVGLLTWLAGTATTSALELAGVGRAEPVGLGVAALTLAAAGIWTLKPRVSDLQTTVRALGLGDALLLTAARTVASATRVLATVAFGLTLVYLGRAIASGGLGSIWSAWVRSTTGVKLLTVVVLAVLVGAVAWQLREARGDIAGAVGDALNRSAIRAAILGRGLPLVAVVAAYVVAWALGRSIAAALAAAIVVGVLLRSGYVLLRRIRYRAAVVPETGQPRRVTVRAWVLPDDDGTEHYYAEIGSGRHAVSAPDREAAVVALAQAVDEHARGQDITPSVASFHADQLLRSGIVDREAVRTKVREQVRKAALECLRPELQAERETFEAALEEYPPDLTRRRLARMAPALRRHPDWVALDEDYYERMTEPSPDLPTAD